MCTTQSEYIHFRKSGAANDVLGIIKFNLAQQLVQVKSEKVHETILRAKPSRKRNTTHTVSLSLSHQAENKIPTAIRVVQLKLTTQMYTDIPKQTQIERASFWNEKRKNRAYAAVYFVLSSFDRTKMWERDNWTLRSKRRRTWQHLSPKSHTANTGENRQFPPNGTLRKNQKNHFTSSVSTYSQTQF